MWQNVIIAESSPANVLHNVTNLISLGYHEGAVRVLLNTDTNHECFYENSLMACLLAATTDSGASQSTVKLVATNLIASGRMNGVYARATYTHVCAEGALLLCLIGKCIDACRYMQAYGQHTRAAVLARVSCSVGERMEVMSKYADHLLNTVDCCDKVCTHTVCAHSTRGHDCRP